MNAAQRRAAIVDAAINLFSRRGFRGATTKELALNVGVSEPILYQHFDTKRSLYEAILQTKVGHDRETIACELHNSAETTSLRDFLVFVGRALLDWYITDPRYARMLLFASLDENEMARLFYESQVSVFYDCLTKYLARQMDAGAIRRMDPLLAARIFAGMVSHQGIIFAVYRPGDLAGGDRNAMVDAIVDIYLNGVKTDAKA